MLKKKIGSPLLFVIILTFLQKKLTSGLRVEQDIWEAWRRAPKVAFHRRAMERKVTG